jgi:hypothetical protein
MVVVEKRILSRFPCTLDGIAGRLLVRVDGCSAVGLMVRVLVASEAAS